MGILPKDYYDLSVAEVVTMIAGYYERLSDYSKLLYGDQSTAGSKSSRLGPNQFLQVFGAMYKNQVTVRSDGE